MGVPLSIEKREVYAEPERRDSVSTAVRRIKAGYKRWRVRGQGLVEYALIMVLIAVAILLILTYVGSVVQVSLYSKIGSGMQNAGGG